MTNEMTLAWVRHLPEVGSAVRGLADEEERIAEEITRARALVARLEARARALEARLEAEAAALRARADRAVAVDWSAEEIAAAKAVQPTRALGVRA